jgi:hypothetical protein
VQRSAQREGIILEYFVNLCQVGIERVQRVHEKKFVLIFEIREVPKEDTYKVTEHFLY